MKLKSLDMTKGSVTKVIVAFALPIFLGNIFQQVYNIADTAIAGHLLGDNALSAIGSTTSLYAFLMYFIGGLNGGFSLVIARFFGENNKEKIKKSIVCMLFFNAIFTMLSLVFSFTLLKPVMMWLKIPNDIFGDAYKYVIIIFCGTAVTCLYNAQSNLLRALGNSLTPIVYLVISSVINIILDIVFIKYLSLGVMGASLATVVAQIVSVILCLFDIRRNYREYKLNKSSFVFEKTLYKEMFFSGINMAMMNCIFAIGSLILQGAINGLGKLIIAGHLAARKIAEIFMQPMITISASCSTFVSQNYGANKYDRIKKGIENSIFIELSMAVVFIVVVYLFTVPMIKLITGTADDTIIGTAKQYLHINLPFYISLGVLYVLRTSIQSIGKRFPALMSSTIELLSKCMCAWFLTSSFGYIGVCVAEPISWVLGALLLIFSFSKAYKKELV